MDCQGIHPERNTTSDPESFEAFDDRVHVFALSEKADVGKSCFLRAMEAELSRGLRL